MAKLFEEKLSIWDKIRLYRPYILLIIALMMLFVYIFILIFGNKSVFVLLELREEKKELETSVKFYERQNAFLQKEIFEISGGK
ncbi:hypothetical protein CCY99_02525 [Helicobacter sp. 16-1353]|uniref:hypothetical protein n=1 Tax=Helicobacter sp. 16-1353 TaxID=2004996 RepID=UPI000DCDD327|nr:hypothetical protein [Helicobacter sp. 16-1353]RAX54658.1 hypothetical protein CCY99_02525 [Helicobacter sp. 16-1353]